MTEEDKVLFFELVELLREVFSDKTAITFLSDKEREYLTYTKDDVPECNFSAVGYPRSPILGQIASYFVSTMKTGSCAVTNLRKFTQFDEGYQPHERSTNILFIRDDLQGALGLWEHMNRGQKRQKLISVIRRLRRRGLLDLLLLRRTFGSLERVLIPRELLYEAAEELINPSSSLTVCGRARDKHIARDSTGRWGTACMDDKEKNKAARKMMEEILDLAEWINIHHLPQSIPTLEIRDPNGFGLRFDVEPLRFRGFLEPYAKDGWMNRFKH